MMVMEDGTPDPLRCCPTCAGDTEPGALPLVLPCPEVVAIWELGETIAEIDAPIAGHRVTACAHCAALPLPIPPARETRLAIGVEVA